MFTSQPIAYVHTPHLDTSSIPKGMNAKHDAEGQTDRHASEPDQERIARAVDGPREHVAAEPVARV